LQDVGGKCTCWRFQDCAPESEFRGPRGSESLLRDLEQRHVQEERLRDQQRRTENAAEARTWLTEFWWTRDVSRRVFHQCLCPQTALMIRKCLWPRFRRRLGSNTVISVTNSEWFPRRSVYSLASRDIIEIGILGRGVRLLRSTIVCQ